MLLKDFDFSNLYLESQIDRSRFRGTDAKARLLSPPADLHADMYALFKNVFDMYKRNPDVIDFAVNHDDYMYRVSVISDVNGLVFAVRRGAKEVPDFQRACGVHPDIISRLLSVKSGLVLFIGPFSSGKSTAAAALLRAFVMYTGGFGLTLEDPPELPLSGDHGDGRILQIQVTRDRIEQEISNIMRATFDAVLVSELRTPKMAAEAIQNASAGRLVISTLHADSIPSGLQRLASMASGVTGSSDAALRFSANLLADGFQAAVEMAHLGERQWGAVRYLLSENCWGQGGIKGVDGKIRNGEFAALRNDMMTQMNMLGKELFAKTGGSR